MVANPVDLPGKDGGAVPAAAEANKNGFLYVVNRDNGKLICRSDAFVKHSPSEIIGAQAVSDTSFESTSDIHHITGAHNLVSYAWCLVSLWMRMAQAQVQPGLLARPRAHPSSPPCLVRIVLARLSV